MILKQATQLREAVSNPATTSFRQIDNAIKGWVGETCIASALDKRLHDDPERHVLHDVRIALGPRQCQIDHLILTPRRIVVLETKNYEGIVIRDAHDRWALVSYDLNVTHIKPPSQQVLRAAGILKNVLEAANIEVTVSPTLAFGPLSTLQLRPSPGSPPVIDHSRMDDWLRDLIADSTQTKLIDREMTKTILQVIRSAA